LQLQLHAAVLPSIIGELGARGLFPHSNKTTILGKHGCISRQGEKTCLNSASRLERETLPASPFSNVLNTLHMPAEETDTQRGRCRCGVRRGRIEVLPSRTRQLLARPTEDLEMNTAMQMNPMMTGMMPMMGTVPMNPMMMGGMPMNGMMNMNGMMPMMNGMMPMPMMPMMMCKMTMKMTADGMVCEMMPMDGMSKDMFMECCKRMSMMMGNGMPMMMMCGGMGMMAQMA
jgi:hypothetical protein